VLLLSDEDVARLPPRAAAEAISSMLLDHHAGHFVSPPRATIGFPSMRVLVGAAGDENDGYGLRVSSVGAPNLEHLTVTYRPDGQIDALILGNRLGALRTGAVCAVAAGLLAPPGALRVGLVGSGRNAWAQIWALLGVREIEQVSVYSPTPDHRAGFAARVTAELGVPARAVADPRSAVEDCHLVILCTRSETPVIEADWVASGAHVTTVGPKSATAHECPAELLDRVRLAVSEAPGELVSPLTSLGDVPVVALGALLAGRPGPARPGDTTLFLVAGFGGADVAFARSVARLAGQPPQ
jgi:alanine dehydrogenase